MTKLQFEYSSGEHTQTEGIGSIGVGTWEWTGQITAIEIKGVMTPLAVPIPYAARQINKVAGQSCNSRTISTSFHWDITVIWPDFAKLDEFRARRAEQIQAGLPKDEIETYAPETAGYYIGASTHHIDRDPSERRALQRMLTGLYGMADGLGVALRYNKPHFLRQFIEAVQS